MFTHKDNKPTYKLNSRKLLAAMGHYASIT